MTIHSVSCQSQRLAKIWLIGFRRSDESNGNAQHSPAGALAVSIWAQGASASTISYTGNFRADATFLGCGGTCTLGAGHSDGDFAQYAAVVRTFKVPIASAVQIVSFSYGGGVNGDGTNILEGGLEPYMEAGRIVTFDVFGSVSQAYLTGYLVDLAQ